MNDKIKGWGRFTDALERAIEANKGGAGLALADATKRLRKLVERTEADEVWEEVEQPQTRGPTVKFKGRSIAFATAKVRDGEADVSMEIWETPKGALVACSIMSPQRGFEDVRVAVVEPSEDVPAMRRAVLDHFNWDYRAREMVRDQLGWDLSLEVE